MGGSQLGISEDRGFQTNRIAKTSHQDNEYEVPVNPKAGRKGGRG
jgi:hypothetical protein